VLLPSVHLSTMNRSYLPPPPPYIPSSLSVRRLTFQFFWRLPVSGSPGTSAQMNVRCAFRPSDGICSSSSMHIEVLDDTPLLLEDRPTTYLSPGQWLCSASIPSRFRQCLFFVWLDFVFFSHHDRLGLTPSQMDIPPSDALYSFY